jgi:hypothetical protein
MADKELLGISDSRAAAVIGFSGPKARLAVWQEIVEEQCPGWNAAHGYTIPAQEETAAMRWETAFKDAMTKLTVTLKKGHITKQGRVYTDVIRPCGAVLTCTIDGVIGGKLYTARVVSTSDFKTSWGTQHIPGSYQAQIQHSLFVTGLSEAAAVCLELPKTPDEWEAAGWRIRDTGDDSRGELGWRYWLKYKNYGDKVFIPYRWASVLEEMGYFHCYTVAADPVLQNTILDSYAQFWASVKTRNPPRPENHEDILRLFPELRDRAEGNA